MLVFNKKVIKCQEEKKYIVYIREEAQIEYEANSPKEALDQFDREINDHQEFLEEYGEFYITIERKNKK